jgi:aspartyl aminopeptidase
MSLGPCCNDISYVIFWRYFFLYFPAVEECAKRLIAAGFKELREAEPWKIKPLDKVLAV